jgi:hypothetical protein
MLSTSARADLRERFVSGIYGVESSMGSFAALYYEG